jgi:hypothetical protein
MSHVFIYNDTTCIVNTVNTALLRQASRESVQASFDFGTGESAHRSINNFSVFVKEECGNPLHAMKRRSLRGVIDVYFRELYLPRVASCQFIQNWVKTFAVASPRCCKIKQHESWERRNFPPECGIGHIDRCVRKETGWVQRLFAFSASRAFFPTALWYSILRLAFRAANNYSLFTHERHPQDM